MEMENSAKTMADLMVSDDNSISTLLVNAISGNYTDELVDAIWNSTFDLDVLEAIETYLWELHDAEQYSEFSGALRMMYLVFSVDVPDVVNAILQSGNDELLKAYFYEFLADYEELKYDYDNDDDESDDK